MSEIFESERAPEPVGAFPHAKRVGDLLFLSGIGPRVRGSKEIPGVTLDSAGNVISYDIETQCRAVFENVRLVLEDAGAALGLTTDSMPSILPDRANPIQHARPLRSARCPRRLRSN